MHDVQRSAVTSILNKNTTTSFVMDCSQLARALDMSRRDAQRLVVKLIQQGWTPPDVQSSDGDASPARSRSPLTTTRSDAVPDKKEPASIDVFNDEDAGLVAPALPSSPVSCSTKPRRLELDRIPPSRRIKRDAPKPAEDVKPIQPKHNTPGQREKESHELHDEIQARIQRGRLLCMCGHPFPCYG